MQLLTNHTNMNDIKITRGAVRKLQTYMNYMNKEVAAGIGVTEQHYGMVIRGIRKSQPCLNAAYAWLVGRNHVEESDG